jgi:hypothetical protein
MGYKTTGHYSELQTKYYGKGLSHGYNIAAPYIADRLIKLCRKGNFTSITQFCKRLDELGERSLSGSIPTSWTSLHIKKIDERAGNRFAKTFPNLIPKPPILVRKRWVANTDYKIQDLAVVIDDFVTTDWVWKRRFITYKCVKEHTSGEVFKEDFERNCWIRQSTKYRTLAS